MKNCKNCGHENAVDAKFCVACGKILGDSATQNDSPAQQNVLSGNFLLDNAKPQYGGRNYSTTNTETRQYGNRNNSARKTEIRKPVYLYFTDALKNYVQFNGRATRKQYWMFVLVYSIIATLLSLLPINMIVWGPELCGGRSPLYDMINISLYDMITISAGFIYGLYILYCLITFVPALAITWRRMHDINRSGTWFFITLIPVIGVIWFIVLLCQPGDEEDNEYGPVPFQENELVKPPVVFGKERGAISQNSVARNTAKIIRIVEDRIFVGCSDGTFFDVSSKDLDFQPVVGDVVFVFTSGDLKIITNRALF